MSKVKVTGQKNQNDPILTNIFLFRQESPQEASHQLLDRLADYPDSGAHLNISVHYKR